MNQDTIQVMMAEVIQSRHRSKIPKQWKITLKKHFNRTDPSELHLRAALQIRPLWRRLRERHHDHPSITTFYQYRDLGEVIREI
jgi:hypothetical protein